METYSLHYTPKNGWSAVFPEIDSPQTLVLIFGPANWQEHGSAIQALITHYSQALLLGCSGYGTIQAGGILDETLTVNITRFQNTCLRLTKCPIHGQADSFAVGQALADELIDPDLKAVLVFSDGLKTNGAKLSEAMNHKLSRSVVIVGGLAGDSQQFTSTWTLANQLPQSQQVVALGFYGETIQLKTAVRVGWSAIGPERQVTLANGNKLYTLDNRPAMELYKQYLGKQSTNLTKNSLHFPLAIRPKNKPYSLIRTPMVLDEATQTLIFAGDIPENSTAQLVHVSISTLVNGAYEASAQLAAAIKDHQDQTMLVLTISCGARRGLMAEEAGLELTAVCSNLPKHIQQIGYYSFGELAPHHVRREPENSPYCSTGDCSTCLAIPSYGLCELHNQTITLTAIYEQDAS
ncbi:FIST signal transduction protein [uncultured Thiothrix sp.]|uniref:FIST signal transduction protein n=1 Tax=uncultured Thiothrix sp. TaxID=223185 RepID=UPI002636BA6A|nr:FIST N-terminal domain-containing protein [uncultured Thiothrix sp.]